MNYLTVDDVGLNHTAKNERQKLSAAIRLPSSAVCYCDSVMSRDLEVEFGTRDWMSSW